jgi:hypothetical protein
VEKPQLAGAHTERTPMEACSSWQGLRAGFYRRVGRHEILSPAALIEPGVRRRYIFRVEVLAFDSGGVISGSKDDRPASYAALKRRLEFRAR